MHYRVLRVLEEVQFAVFILRDTAAIFEIWVEHTSSNLKTEMSIIEYEATNMYPNSGFVRTVLNYESRR